MTKILTYGENEKRSNKIYLSVGTEFCAPKKKMTSFSKSHEMLKVVIH